jgi:hypothetical protein
MQRIQYLGYILDAYGVNVDRAKIQVIRDCSSPEKNDQALQLLGPC